VATWREERPLEAPERPSEAIQYGNTSSPDPKPVKRLRASQSDWCDIHQGFSGLPCTSCGQGEPLDLHHILPRSQGGDDLSINLVVLCRSCHTKLEGHESGWERVAAAVRQYVVTDNRRRHYQEDHAGDFFNCRYPPLPHSPQVLEDFRVINESHASEAVEGYEVP
jgi:hypothetical protein